MDIKKYIRKLYVKWLRLIGKAIDISSDGKYPGAMLSNFTPYVLWYIDRSKNILKRKTNMMILRRLKIKWQVFRGKAIDIWSKDPYPSNVLSNLCSNGFKFDGMICGSMEGFLQSLKQKDINKQRQICSMKGKNAKKMTTNAWQCDQIVWWKGNAIDRQSEDFMKLVRAAYQCMFEQNERFRMALMETRGMPLYHSRGESNPYKTILTEQEFCGVLAEIRDCYDMREKIVPKLRICEFEDMSFENSRAATQF